MPQATSTEKTKDMTTPKKRAPRKRVAAIDGPVSARNRSSAVSDLSVPVRKAPTPLAQNKRTQARHSSLLLIIIVICVVTTTVGVLIGVSGEGQIDVVAVVNERNEKINRGEVRDDQSGVGGTLLVPVQNRDTRPNGGLTASPVSKPAPSEEVSIPVSTSTATSSEVNEIEEDELLPESEEPSTEESISEL